MHSAESHRHSLCSCTPKQCLYVWFCSSCARADLLVIAARGSMFVTISLYI
eukprot:UN24233